MKIKLKNGERLETFGCYEGFSKDNWVKLNSGEVIEIDSIPVKTKHKVQEVVNSKKPKSNTKGKNTKNKKGVSNGN